MIKSFKHKGLEKFYESGNTKGVQANHAKKLRMQLAALDTAQFIDDMLRWRLVRIAHAQINNVLPLLTSGMPQRVDFSDDIRRQPLHPVKLIIHMFLPDHPPKIKLLGSGTDHAPFAFYAGVPCINLRFKDDAKVNVRISFSLHRT